MIKKNKLLRNSFRVVATMLSVGMLVAVIYFTLKGNYDVYYDYDYAESLCNKEKEKEGSCCKDVIKIQKSKGLPVAVNLECPEGYLIEYQNCIATPPICLKK